MLVPVDGNLGIPLASLLGRDIQLEPFFNIGGELGLGVTKSRGASVIGIPCVKCAYVRFCVVDREKRPDLSFRPGQIPDASVLICLSRSRHEMVSAVRFLADRLPVPIRFKRDPIQVYLGFRGGKEVDISVVFPVTLLDGRVVRGDPLVPVRAQEARQVRGVPDIPEPRLRIVCHAGFGCRAFRVRGRMQLRMYFRISPGKVPHHAIVRLIVRITMTKQIEV